jgi:hypothetical protein
MTRHLNDYKEEDFEEFEEFKEFNKAWQTHSIGEAIGER